MQIDGCLTRRRCPQLFTRRFEGAIWTRGLKIALPQLIHARCPHTLGWLQRHERATTVLAQSPWAGRA
ncbi:hypothetical protein I5U62_15370 [Stenotrophomonas maltophilia]|nr:hypothetical protein [Stenotrophomonas maltophilia]